MIIDDLTYGEFCIGGGGGGGTGGAAGPCDTGCELSGVRKGGRGGILGAGC